MLALVLSCAFAAVPSVTNASTARKDRRAGCFRDIGSEGHAWRTTGTLALQYRHPCDISVVPRVVGVSRLGSLLKQTLREIREDKISVYAAQMAYTLFFSFF